RRAPRARGAPRRPSPTRAASGPSWWRSTTAPSAAPPRPPRPGPAAGHPAVPGRHREPPPRGAGRRPGPPRPGRGRHVSTQTGPRAGDARAGIAVANAPVSYGAFEITVGHDPNVPDGISVLDQVAEAGYAGIDLGPVGYLGSGGRLGELLAER